MGPPLEVLAMAKRSSSPNNQAGRLIQVRMILHDLPPDANVAGTDLDHLVSSYAGSHIARNIQADIDEAIAAASRSSQGQPNGDTYGSGNIFSGRVQGYQKLGLLGQFQGCFNTHMAQSIPQPHADAHALRHLNRPGRLPWRLVFMVSQTTFLASRTDLVFYSSSWLSLGLAR